MAPGNFDDDDTAATGYSHFGLRIGEARVP